MKRLFAIAMILASAFAFTSAATAATPQTTLPEIEDEVMCPICGTLLGLSRAPAAERERVFIRKLIAQGKTKDEIEDALVAEYGPQVMALPDDKGINVWAYVVPVLVFVIAAISVLWAVIRWRKNRDQQPPGGTSGSGPKPPGEDDKRLDEDMARYDL